MRAWAVRMGVRLAGTCLCVLIWTWPPAGLASDAAGPDDWKSEADARIEQIRKRDVEIVVADRLGQPVAGARRSRPIRSGTISPSAPASTRMP